MPTRYAPSNIAQNHAHSELIQTMAGRIKTLVLQEMEYNLMWHWLRRSANWISTAKGFELPLIEKVSPAGQFVDSTSTLPTQGTTEVRNAAYSNCYLAVPVTTNFLIMKEDEADPEALWTQLQFQEMLAKVGANRQLSNSVLNGTGVGVNPSGLFGHLFERALPAAQTGVVGGIDRATNSWWQHPANQLTVNFGTIAVGTTIPAGILAIVQTIQDAAVGHRRPNIGLTTKNTFDLIRRSAWEQGVGYYFMKDENSARMGFDTVIIDGVTFTWDEQMPANTLWAGHIDGLPTTTDERWGGPGEDLDWTEAQVDMPIDLVDHGVFGIRNEKVDGAVLSPQQETLGFNRTHWIMSSVNFGVGRAKGQCVLFSAGNELETW